MTRAKSHRLAILWLIHLFVWTSVARERLLTIDHSSLVASAEANSLAREDIEGNHAKKKTQTNDSSFHRKTRFENLRDLLVNGEDVSPKDYQYFGFADIDELNADLPYLLCAGTLIHPTFFLTAAHCHGAFIYGINLYDPITEDFTREVQITSQHRFPDYNLKMDNINFDILLLQLEEPINDIEPVTLHDGSTFALAAGDKLQALGLGFTAHEGRAADNLQIASFEYIDNESCDQLSPFQNVDFNEDVLCANTYGMRNSSICQGDSGGPLITEEGTQVGVVSFTLRCEPDTVPDGFARVSYFYDWIQQRICDLSSEDPPVGCIPSPRPEPREVEMRIYFRHDFFPEETTYAIRNKGDNSIDYAGPTYVPGRGETWRSVFWLLPGEYEFEVYDSFGDGLISAETPVRNGAWEIYAVYDETNEIEVRVASGTALFRSQQTTTFRVEDFSPSPSNNPTQSQSPSKSPSLGPTVSPSRTPSNFPSQTPTPRPTAAPTRSPSGAPSSIPTPNPSLNPTKSPTMTPSSSPSASPTKTPTQAPTRSPTSSPTTSNAPSRQPKASLSQSPTQVPSLPPSLAPTTTPTAKPTTRRPTENPTRLPTIDPTIAPSPDPTTSSPTLKPTKSMTLSATLSPTQTPTTNPTMTPSLRVASVRAPTMGPTKSPSTRPTKSPTTAPSTRAPSINPSGEPSTSPTPIPTTDTPTSWPVPNPTNPPMLAPITLPPIADSSPSSAGSLSNPMPTRSPSSNPPEVGPTQAQSSQSPVAANNLISSGCKPESLSLWLALSLVGTGLLFY